MVCKIYVRLRRCDTIVNETTVGPKKPLKIKEQGFQQQQIDVRFQQLEKRIL